jgi:hypothetical protein
MVINHEKTAERCRVLNMAALAKEFDVTRTTVWSVINGKYRRMRSPTALAILARLREMNLLVEHDESHDETIAA